MKKLVAAACALAAGLALAEVESANVVGYQEFTFPAGQQMTMFGIMFDGVGGTEMTVQDIFADRSVFTGGASRAYADQILYWTGTTYHVLYLNQSANVSRNGFWCNGGTPPAGGDWGSNNAKCTHVVQPGDAFWVKRYDTTGAITVKMVGQVVVGQDGSKSVSISEGMTLVGMPFTAPFIPNPDKVDASKSKIDWEALGCVGGSSRAYADQLTFWNGSNYHVLYLNKSANATRNGYWCNGGTPPSGDGLSWGGNNAPSTVVYVPGGAFWYKRLSGSSAFSLSFTQPYEL